MAEATRKVRFLQGVVIDAEKSAKEREVVEVSVQFANWAVFVGQAEDIDQHTPIGVPAPIASPMVRNQDPNPTNQDPKVKK